MQSIKNCEAMSLLTHSSQVGLEKKYSWLSSKLVLQPLYVCFCCRTLRATVVSVNPKLHFLKKKLFEIMDFISRSWQDFWNTVRFLKLIFVEHCV